MEKPEKAAEIELAEGDRNAAAHILVRRDRTVIDRAADGRRGRGVDVGGAEVDVDLLDQLGIELLVGINGIVARIVERNAVEGQADARAVETANVERAARRAIGVIVLEVK